MQILIFVKYFERNIGFILKSGFSISAKHLL